MRIRVIDAFTDRPFAGNPAAVCLLYGDGELNPRPRVRVLRETAGALLLDGDRGVRSRRAQFGR